MRGRRKGEKKRGTGKERMGKSEKVKEKRRERLK